LIRLKTTICRVPQKSFTLYVGVCIDLFFMFSIMSP